VRSPPSARDLASADATFSLSPGINAYVGYTVARVGDQDGDGLPDAAITAYYDDTFGADAGTVYLTSGTSTGSNDLADAYGRQFGQTYGHLGDAIAPLGDIDGDGVEDLLVGNTGYLIGSLRFGGAWVLPGG
jgi:hypothetical protein